MFTLSTALTPDRQRHPAHAGEPDLVGDVGRAGSGGHAGHPCMRSSSVNQIRSCTS